MTLLLSLLLAFRLGTSLGEMSVRQKEEVLEDMERKIGLVDSSHAPPPAQYQEPLSWTLRSDICE